MSNTITMRSYIKFFRTQVLFLNVFVMKFSDVAKQMFTDVTKQAAQKLCGSLQGNLDQFWFRLRVVVITEDKWYYFTWSLILVSITKTIRPTKTNCLEPMVFLWKWSLDQVLLYIILEFHSLILHLYHIT